MTTAPDMMSDMETDRTTPGERHWLVHSKLTALRQQIRLAARGRLSTLLDRSLTAGVGIVIAPAGFGKTTLLTQWRDSLIARDMAVAWLTLDEDDREALQFLSYVIFALEVSALDLGTLPRRARRGLMETDVKASLSTILDAILRSRRHHVLILDDFHRAASPAVEEAVRIMVAASVPNLTIILSSRHRPELDLPRLAAAGRVVEVDAETLRFSDEDTREILGEAVENATLAKLMRRTEGWPVAIQLAKLAAERSATEAGGGIDDEDDPHISKYLADQVLNQLPPDLQDFLIATSILERFDVSLANAVCGTDHGWTMIERLEPLLALVIPLDGRRQWFRYHHLFADHLRAMQRQRHPGRERVLHRRAFEWFRDAGYLSEAARHAALSGDVDLCAGLIEGVGGWEYLLFGGVAQLRNLLRNIPQAALQHYPRLQLAQAYLLLKEGAVEGARALFEGAAHSMGAPGADPALDRDLLSIDALLRIYDDGFRDWADVAHLQSGQSRLPPADGVGRGVLASGYAVGALALGRFDEAEAGAARAHREMQRVNCVVGVNYCYLHAGLAHLHRGRLNAAETRFQQARQLAEETFGVDSGLRVVADMLLGVAAYWRGGQDEARWDQFQNALRDSLNNDGWPEIYATGLDVLLHAAAHGPRVIDIGAETDRMNDARPGTTRLSLVRDAQRLQQALAEEDKASAHRLAYLLETALPTGCWRNDPTLWRPYQSVGLVLARYHGGEDRSRSLAILRDVADCCEAHDARLAAVPALVAIAVLLDAAGDRNGALVALEKAVALSAAEGLAAPFHAVPDIAPLVAALLRRGVADRLHLDFLSACQAVMRTIGPPISDALALTEREREVFVELMRGRSNKEIARTLALTDHTVKFHLGNIFRKMGVSRRSEAIMAASRP